MKKFTEKVDDIISSQGMVNAFKGQTSPRDRQEGYSVDL